MDSLGCEQGLIRRRGETPYLRSSAHLRDTLFLLHTISGLVEQYMIYVDALIEGSCRSTCACPDKFVHHQSFKISKQYLVFVSPILLLKYASQYAHA